MIDREMSADTTGVTYRLLPRDVKVACPRQTSPCSPAPSERRNHLRRASPYHKVRNVFWRKHGIGNRYVEGPGDDSGGRA
jgi:hypothetical protein